VSDQLSKDENVCSCLNGIRFVPKMPPLLGHAPSTAPATVHFQTRDFKAHDDVAG
jgi:hypothetical protein